MFKAQIYSHIYNLFFLMNIYYVYEIWFSYRKSDQQK